MGLKQALVGHLGISLYIVHQYICLLTLYLVHLADIICLPHGKKHSLPTPNLSPENCLVFLGLNLTNPFVFILQKVTFICTYHIQSR